VIDENGQLIQLGPDNLGIFSQGGNVTLAADERDARFLLIGGKPLGEPVARGGPFVMNTRAEVQQAFEDYRQGRF